MSLKPLVLVLPLLFAPAAFAQQQKLNPDGQDVVPYTPPQPQRDFTERDEMIPMRDGVKLYTVIMIPSSAKNVPIILTRTPYNAQKRAHHVADTAKLMDTLGVSDAEYVKAGWIRVYQDIRGKYGSEGNYTMTRFPRGPMNASKTDDSTDAYDTIDWLIKNIPQTNGKVGMIGSSYEGWTVVMALLAPHPAMKAAVPESPMVDGWMGDDWFHYGAFRQVNVDYFTAQMSMRGDGQAVPRHMVDDYEAFLRAGSAGDWVKQNNVQDFPWWQRLSANPAYDDFWQDQALDHLIAKNPPDIPTMWEQGLWDQEDMWGAIHSYEALKAVGHGANNYIVMGPWYHSQVGGNGSSIGPLKWNGDTALQFRRDFVMPFFRQYLADGPDAHTPHARIYNTGENHWQEFADWPVACPKDCKTGMTPMYFESSSALGYDKPGAEKGDSYISDPAKPVPYLPLPIAMGDYPKWQQYLVWDQRFVSTRPDVLVYETAALTAPVAMQGRPIADIFASTTGSDTDWVVKLIDVYPDQYTGNADMPGGYQLPVSLDIFRGRYRDSFDKPEAVKPGRVEEYKFGLPMVNHVFQPGHRIMVQVQSSLFPVYDRNPQTYVPNIFFAKPEDYKKETITVLHDKEHPSSVMLPIVP